MTSFWLHKWPSTSESPDKKWSRNVFNHSWGYGWNFPTKFDMCGCKLCMFMIPLLALVSGTIQVWLYGAVSKSLVSHYSVTSQKHWTVMIYPITLVVGGFNQTWHVRSNSIYIHDPMLKMMFGEKNGQFYGRTPYHGQSLIRVLSPMEDDGTHLGCCWIQPDGVVAHVKIKGCCISEAF